MRILVTNDDGIYAPGLEALAREVSRLGSVEIFAPAVEQSGVSHSITYLEPLIVHDEYRDGKLFGRAVHGSPADCVKIALLEFCEATPDLIVSGINSGANAGINVLYSGTVAAAIEGAFFGVTSIATSLVLNGPPDYPRAAQHVVHVIEQLLEHGVEPGSLWNINIPEGRPEWPRGVKVLPMGIERYAEIMERRYDPRGRVYFWSGTDPQGEHPAQPDTDVEGLAEGYITVTPLHFNLTHRARLDEFRRKSWR